MAPSVEYVGNWIVHRAETSDVWRYRIGIPHLRRMRSPDNNNVFVVMF